MHWKASEHMARKRDRGNQKLLLGNIPVASVVFDELVAQNSPEKYRVDCFLPGLAQYHTYATSPEAGKAFAESMVKSWMGDAELKEQKHGKRQAV